MSRMKVSVQKKWPWVALFCALAVAFVVAGRVYYLKQTSAVEEHEIEELHAIAELKVEQIQEWRRERLADLRVLAQSPYFSDAVAEFVQRPDAKEGESRLRKGLMVVRNDYRYQDALLVGLDGKILLSATEETQALDPEARRTVRDALSAGGAVFGDFYICSVCKGIHIDEACPIVGEGDRPVAVLVFRIDPETHLYPLIRSWPTPSKTGETLLVRREGDHVLFLNELRHRSDTALKLREPLTREDLPAALAVLGKHRNVEGRDYRGIEVVADVHPVPNSPWFLVAKVDKEEILAQVHQEGRVVSLFVVMLVLVAGVGTGLVFTSRQKSLYEDLYLAERGQRETQEELRATLYSIGDAVITTDTNGSIRNMNPVSEDLTGWTEAEARGRPLREVFCIVNEETRGEVENPVQRILHEGTVVGLANHTLLIARDGVERPIEDSGSPIRDEKGQIIGVVLVFRDVTDARRAEEKFRKEKEFTDLTIESLPGMFYVVDENMRFVRWNRYLEKITGYSSEEVKERSALDLFQGEDRRIIEEGIQEVFSLGQAWREAVVVARDGSETPMFLTGRKIAFDNENQLVGMGVDITERKRAEDSLRASEERNRFLAEVIQNASQPFAVGYPDGRLGFVNRAFCDLAGYSEEELRQIDWNLALTPPEWRESEMRHLSELIRTGKPVRYEKEYVRKDGTRVPVELLVHVERSGTGEALLFKAFLTDLTERKQAEDSLRRSKKQWEDIFQAIGHVTLILDLEGNILALNRAAEAAIGRSEEEVLGKKCYEIFHNLDHHPNGCPLARARLTGDVVTEEMEVEALGGYYLVSATPIVGDSGAVARVIHIATDITARKRAEKALRESEERYRLLFENMDNAVAIYRAENNGEDFVFVEFNRSGASIEQISKEELLGKRVTEVFPGAKEFGLFEVLQRVWRTGSPEECPTKLYKDERIEGWRHHFVYKLPSDEIVAVYTDETERERAKQDLDAEKNRFQALAHCSPFGLAMISPDGRFVYTNPKFQEIFGYDLGDIPTGREWFRKAFPDPDHRHEVIAAWLEDLENAGLSQVRPRIFNVRCKDGAQKVIHFRPVLLPSGSHLVTYEDITHSKAAEEALRESEQMLRSIVVATPVGLCITENRIIKWANSAWENMFGFTDESEYVGKPASIMHPSDAQYVRARQKAYNGLAQGAVGEAYTDFMRRDGSQFSGYLRSTYFDPADPSKGTVSAISDVTEIIQAEKSRRESEERYKVLFEDSRDAVFITAIDGIFIDANKSFCDLFGYDRNELESSKVEQMYADPADRRVFQEIIRKTGSLRDFSIQLRKKDGTLFEALVTASVRYSDKGEIMGYQGIIRDVTEKKRLEKQLLQAQKMEAIGTLAGGIAHDFNNVLQVALGYSDLILGDEDFPNRYRTDLKKVFESSRRGADLVQRLLTFSRKTEFKPQPMNVNRRITELKKMLERTIPKMIEIRISLDEDIAAINGDPTQIDQVLMNLAVNARDAMPDGGKLVIETANAMLDEEYVSMHLEAKPGLHVLLTVTDTGLGMDKDTLEHIFEPFYTTKGVGEGTGLGLAIVHGIMKSHGGHITCYSEPGKGTTFRIYLPALESEVETDVDTTGIIPAFGTETVLLADDEKFIRELGARILTKHGYTVLQAENGREALDLFRKEQSRISLVILDLIMPQMGGRECLKALLEIDPNVKVIVASGYSADALVPEIVQGGAKCVVPKPFRVNELLRDVRRVLDEG